MLLQIHNIKNDNTLICEAFHMSNVFITCAVQKVNPEEIN